MGGKNENDATLMISHNKEYLYVPTSPCPILKLRHTRTPMTFKDVQKLVINRCIKCTFRKVLNEKKMALDENYNSKCPKSLRNENF